ncbi:hypothetical protein M6D81_06735 [Paenibacillus sp. J5C_2022]|uniref:hypothetical protein n=1 Tax=Paenibacillus sp. J5C2022 TaxID=2977129 RepID=UPI0021CEFBF7|nr:hypothetical protein [Paenibacillus sp. J5C2022]MCU6708408.1 hypothetical protein [Paenibacillus sp. J5C2022]
MGRDERYALSAPRISPASFRHSRKKAEVGRDERYVLSAPRISPASFRHSRKKAEVEGDERYALSTPRISPASIRHSRSRKTEVKGMSAIATRRLGNLAARRPNNHFLRCNMEKSGPAC